jgi:hypothetical protein
VDHLHDSRDFTLTVHEGTWAYCPAAAASSAHQWVQTDGVSLTDLLGLKSVAAGTDPSSGIVESARDGAQAERRVGERPARPRVRRSRKTI